MKVLHNKKAKKIGLYTGALLLLSAPVFPMTLVNATETDKGNYCITVDDIYHGTFEISQSGTVSCRYVNKKGASLISNNTEKPSPEPDNEQNTSLPVSYDLREENTVTSVKNQGYSGSCWAFASLKSLESNLIKTKKAAPSIDLSENHLSWFLFNPSKDISDPMYLDGITFLENAAKNSYQSENNTIKTSYSYSSYYNALPYLKGSNALLGAFVLARWSGAVTESTAPFNATSTKNLFSMADTMKKNSDAMRYQADYYMTDANCYDGSPQEEIKAAIMSKGALEASFYSDNNNLTENSDGTYAYYQNEKKTEHANHSITIIGWNDNYSRENFGINLPQKDGAWLIANSYGTDYGQNGYFWLSYEDTSLGEIYSFEGTKSSTYDNNYQYDGSGWGSTLLPKKEHPMKVANIFTANKDYTQSLKAVALYTVTANQPYTIEIYKGVQNDIPTNGTLAATLSGTEKYSGYHTISLPNAISLKANEKFSVVVSYHKTNDNNGYIPIEGTTLSSPTLAMNFHSTPGKSFCYAYATNTENGEKSYHWTDLSLTPISTSGNSEGSIYNNVCIKAFTTNESNAGTIQFSSSKYILGAGEKVKLSPKIKKTTEKKITYKSSKPSVASISAAGKINAKKKGNTVITATLPTGATNTLNLSVKAAPMRISTKPKSKKNLKVNKSFKIKIKLPSGTASYTITYNSSNPAVASVNKDGKVTGKRAGTATLTVKTYNKKKAKIKVRVKE